MMSRDEMVREYGRDTTAHLVRAWEASSSLKESVCTPGKEKSWLDLTNLASLDLSGGAYCCRMLLLLETAVLGEEMQNEEGVDKGAKWMGEPRDEPWYQGDVLRRGVFTRRQPRHANALICEGHQRDRAL